MKKMPSVRWKILKMNVMLVFLYVAIGYTDAVGGMQKQISMTADGWKPIIGSSHPPPSHYQEEIKYYQNPILKETVKAEPLPTTTPTSSTATVVRLEPKILQTVPIPVNVVQPGFKKGKLPPHSKHIAQYFVLPTRGGHGPHIPLNSVSQGRPSLHGVLKKGSTKMQHGHMNGKRIIKKPIMGQIITAHSTRNEVYVPAPSAGPYTFYTQGKNVRTRESTGLGNVGQKLISIKQPHAHVEFSGHFPPSNLYQLNSPIQHVIFQKQQVNEVIPSYQIDSQNLLPPPPIFKNFGDLHHPKHNNGKLKTTITRTPSDKYIFGHNPLGPNDLILQLPSYEPSLYGSTNSNTKDKLLPNDVIPNDSPFPGKELDQDYHLYRKPITEYPRSPTYEVTESKWEDNTLPPRKPHRPDAEIQPLELNLPSFLPTPYNVDAAIPTSPTQNEVSTIFNQLSNHVKHYPDTYTHDPYFFDVKEVSTHYPILGKPETYTTPEPPQGATGRPTTIRPLIEEIQTTTEIPKVVTEKPTRSKNRRRRPTPSRIITTTPPAVPVETEKVETTTTSSGTSDEQETERPSRPRRPMKVRPKINNSEEDVSVSHLSTRGRDRYRKRPHQNEFRKNQFRKRVRPYRYESEEDSRSTESSSKEQEVTEVLPIIQHFTTQGFKDFEKEFADFKPTATRNPVIDSAEIEKTDPVKTFAESNEDESSQSSSNQDIDKYSETGDIIYRKKPEYNYDASTSGYEKESNDEEDTTPPNRETLIDFEADTLKNVDKIRKNTPQIVTTTTEAITTVTTLNYPENEIDFSTKITEDFPSVEIKEISKITTTTEPAATTPLPTKPSRRRPIKYNASNRPRFSVKDYRQRLNQYSSTSSTTTESTKSATDNIRLRFPTRLRRPTTSTNAPNTEEITRSKFVPKEPRHSSTYSSKNDVITEKNIKSVNTRLRPFGRTKSTTESSITNTPKISIRPNLFSSRRRPPIVSLKNKIQIRNNNTIHESNNKDTEATSPSHGLQQTTEHKKEEIFSKKDNKPIKTEEDMETDSSSDDILKNDAFMYSQRVSDLTSSMKNDYDGFKAVPTNSRRIPNYYTISTEDPILPIEAFFSNINERVK